ncbi:MAG: alpha/beta hydrolase [Elusimicrobiota bacterium]
MKKALILCLLFFSACVPTNYFYYPNNNLHADPEKFGLTYEIIDFPSLNGKKCTGLLFRTKEKPRGMVVHLHGNYGNVTYHFFGATFLLKYGFDVLVIDYQGYGGSEGRPSPKKTVEDGIAAVRKAYSLNRSEMRDVFIFGQSLGAAVGAQVAMREPLVKAIVMEAGFSSYRQMARHVLKKNVILWFLYPIAPLFIGSTYDPIKAVAHISPKPIFFIHGNQDKIVPVQMTEKLYKQAKEPKKIFIVYGADHLMCWKVLGQEYQEKISDFFLENITIQ